ncbi:RNA-binding protein 7 isoform X1 [Dromaius novaehollandiae]|uniref:RNA-binding protein 7 isoform X1 n=1 Tax=Dromaius novaehollandiae TaxID=8790 RepID=UPI00311D78B5
MRAPAPRRRLRRRAAAGAAAAGRRGDGRGGGRGGPDPLRGQPGPQSHRGADLRALPPGSSHASHDGNSSCSPHGAANTSPSGTPHSASNPSRYDRSPDHMVAAGFTSVQRSPDNLQRQAMMNSAMWQQSQYSGKYDQPGFPVSGYQHGHSFNHSPAPQMQWRPDLPSALRKTRMSSHPYYPEGRHFGREQRFGDRGPDYCRSKSYEDRSRDLDHHYRGSRDESGYDDRNRDGWSHDYDNRRESYREGKWCPSRH